jgi:hypothetical protein
VQSERRLSSVFRILVITAYGLTFFYFAPEVLPFGDKITLLTLHLLQYSDSARSSKKSSEIAQQTFGSNMRRQFATILNSLIIRRLMAS